MFYKCKSGVPVLSTISSSHRSTRALLGRRLGDEDERPDGRMMSRGFFHQWAIVNPSGLAR
jgi:hypothetical protein